MKTLADLPADIRSKVDILFEANAERLGNLADRWQDERNYEDFADYEQVIKEWVEGPAHFGPSRSEVPTSEPVFVSATKRPFGFSFRVGEHRFWMGMKGSNQVFWKWLTA